MDITRVLKIPLDEGGGAKSLGARFGPDAVEQAFKEFPWRCSENGKHPGTVEFIDLARQLALHHCKPDLCISQWFSSHMALLSKSGFVLSGDNSSSYCVVYQVARRYPNPYLILCDAHPDVAPVKGHDKHATWVRRLWEEGILSPSRTLFIGMRDAEKEEHEYLAAKGARCIPAYSIRHESMRPVFMQKIQEQFFDGKSAIVMVVDIDVLDPACAPGTGVPRAGGLSTRQLFELIYSVGGLRAPFKMGEVTEIIPAEGDAMRPLDKKRPDPTNLTASAGALILLEMICSFSQK